MPIQIVIIAVVAIALLGTLLYGVVMNPGNSITKIEEQEKEHFQIIGGGWTHEQQPKKEPVSYSGIFKL